MTLLDTWVHTPAANALSWTLVHSIWQGAALSLALATVVWTARSPRVRYAAACAALAGMLTGFGATLARLNSTEPVFAGKHEAAGIGGWFGQSLAYTVTSSERSVADLLPWLVPFWAAGVMAFSLRNIAGFMGALRLRRRGVCCAPHAWQERVGRLRAQLGISRPVMLVESCLTAAPVVIGYLRPVILIPVGLLAGMPAGQVELILLHELAHVRRHDYFVNLLQVFGESVFFYHPAAWWISRIIREEREKCCDDVVVAVHRNARDYAVALAALEEKRTAAIEPALAATGGNLVRRIRRLLYAHEEARSAWGPFLLFATLTAIVLAAAQAPAPTIAMDTPYLRWLNGDVAYIISSEERVVFERLQTDLEREHFIEQFWLRRDPTPGTPINEFKEEHYRRIAYANQRFASTVPGWKTDRGRTYITWGPPDEIESHPSGGTYQRPAEEGGGSVPVFPFEQWRYNYLEHIGTNVKLEFVDTTGWGEFRMTANPGTKYRSAADRTATAYFSTAPGSRAVVAVTPERTIVVRVPINFAAAQHLVRGEIRGDTGRTAGVFERVVSVCQHSPQTLGCLEMPVLEVVMGNPLEPGQYEFEAVVKDYSGTAQKIYQVKFSVN